MKKLLLTILFCLMAHGAFAYDYTQDANCKGAWLFTEGSGTSVADASGHSNTGTFASSGHPAWAAMSGTGAPSYSPYMVHFDSSASDWISCGTSDTLNITGDLTIVFWASRISGNRGTLFTRVLANPAYGYITSLEDNVRYHTNNTDWRTANTPIGANWHHYAVVVVANTGGTFYLDGSPDGTWTNNPSGASTASSAIAQIGKTFDSLYYNGYATEIAVFNQALSSTEITDIYNNGLKGSTPPSGGQMTTNSRYWGN
jgi:hypothetical protein